MADLRPVAVIAALAEEAHGLVRRMPRAESVGPRLAVWHSGVLVFTVAGACEVAAAMAAQYACDVFKPRCVIAIGLAGGVEDDVLPGQVIVASGAAQHDMDARPLTDAKGVIPGLGLSIIRADAALAEKLARGCPTEDELDAVRRRREFPVRMTQRMQVIAQNNIISVALKPGHQPLQVPLVMRLITAVPWLQGITARFVGLGVRPEHVHSPQARA